MKKSKILFYILIIITLSSVILIVKNQKKEIFKARNLNTGKIETYYEPDISGSLYQRSEESFKTEKKEDLIKILFFAGSAILIIGYLSFYLKKKEDSLNPLINLKVLKENSIISQEEYDTKKNDAIEIEQLQKINKLKEKESQKLIFELENLKNKGIITEQEFNAKILIVKNRKPNI